jgi:hypothetical protein
VIITEPPKKENETITITEVTKKENEPPKKENETITITEVNDDKVMENGKDEGLTLIINPAHLRSRFKK